MPSLDLYRQGALLINRRGERFSDETANPSDQMPDQPDGEAFVVMDGELAKAFQAWPNFISTAPGIAYAYIDDYRRNRPDIFSAPVRWQSWPRKQAWIRPSSRKP